MPGTLYLVATPIGNLQDITYRAVEVLRSVDIIACEDTRHTRKLLNHLASNTRLVSYHEHNESERAEELVSILLDDRSVAVVSDAGTPGIADPGFRLVQRAIERGIQVVPVPGPVAFINALIASGLPTDAVFFGGFLPSKKNERRKRLAEIADVSATIALYESPRRIAAALTDCLEILGNRNAAVAREITKLHEQFYRGTLADLSAQFSSAGFKGEIVLLIDRVRTATIGDNRGLSLMERLTAIEAEGIDHKSALKRVAKEFGISKSEAYRIVQAERQGNT